MSIKLRFEKGSLITQVALKDEALKELLDLISKHQSDEASPATSPISPTISSETSFQGGDRIELTKQWMAKHSSSEMLNMINWETNPEKILIMGAFHEASGGQEGWRSADMENRFSEAKEAPPSNFPRDISKAIKEGLIATVTPRTYKVSRTGWNKLCDAISKLVTT